MPTDPHDQPAASSRYVAEAFGWMTIVEADTAREALRIAKSRAGSASLLPSDIQRVRPATDAHVSDYLAMGGRL